MTGRRQGGRRVPPAAAGDARDATGRTSRWRRPDASMSLLADLFAEQGLDPGYAAAAERRRAAGPDRGRRCRDRQVRTFAVLVVAGLVASVAAVQARRTEPVAQRQRERLITEIRSRTAQTDALQRELDRQRALTRSAEALALDRDAAGRAARRDLNRVAAAAAAAPVEAPGIVVTVGEAEPRKDRPGDRPAEAGRLFDRDLQQLVNGLWAAGAQAIGINGQRLTATTAIRSAGEAVLVDFRPLSPPYVVSATGDPDLLRPAFGATAAARHFRTLHASFGIRFDVRTEREVRLPAASVQRLRYARKGGEK